MTMSAGPGIGAAGHGNGRKLQKGRK
jgi:hypothetical protein